MNKLTAYCAIIAIYMAALFFLHSATTPYSRISDKYVNQYNATCRIITKGENSLYEYSSTGVLLETGYILTAAHCVDVNFDGNISSNEMNPTVEFAGISAIYTSHVLYCGNPRKTDIAVLWIDKFPHSSISLGDSKFGDELFTIGSTLGGPPNISTGLSSSHTEGHARASIPAWKGNSGGGVWKGDKLVGIVSRVGIATIRERMNITIPTRNGLSFGRGALTTHFPLANWLSYSDRGEIELLLDEQNLGYVYENINDYSLALIYLKMAGQILMVVACATAFRKYIFS